MASKLREDLPSRPDRRYDRETIKIFNEHRKEYRENVKLAKSLYGSIAAIIDEDCDQYEGETKMFIMMVKSGKNGQMLIKHSPKEKNGEYFIRLNRKADIITAFYIPKDLEWMKFTTNQMTIGTFCGEPIEIDLETILAESLTVPDVNDHFLEIILWKSRQGKYGVAHSQEEELTIDGVTYKRVIFIQPMFPLTSTPFCDHYIYLSDKRDIYIETGMALTELRNELCNSHMLAWCEDKTDQMPLVRIRDGSMVKLFDGKKVEDELEINKELFDTLSCNIPNDILSTDVNIGDPNIFKA
uniref:Uncharacterized protein n=1 Tax=Marseillevirus LCMAC101 TaxID=2506602 RepID=A0A481YS62_9VIRU|nr:MAG: hypothetical protein LCMAC101_03850 [Marseillevirus LCMAC101]